MADRIRVGVAIAATAGLFLLIHLGGLALVAPLLDTEASTEPTGGADPILAAVFVVALLLVTAGMLAAFRWGLTWLVRGLVLFVSFGLSWFVLDTFLPSVVAPGGIAVLPVLLAGGLTLALYRYPEWYVLDITGVLVGSAAVAMLGLTLGVQAVIVLLVLLAVYDLISVHGTKHMLTLAEGAMRSHLPVMLVIPLHSSFSLLSETDDQAEAREHEDEDDETFTADGALIIGVGDAVIPGMLATSVALYGPVEPTAVLGIPLNEPILGVIGGTIVGLLGLMTIANRGSPQPGLPFLSSGAILGYLIGAIAIGVGPLEALGLA